MSNALAHNAGVFLTLPATDIKASAEPPSTGSKAKTDDAPIGYRWVSKRWRVLPDGTRDYAAYYGKTAFSTLLPVSSRLRTHK